MSITGILLIFLTALLSLNFNENWEQPDTFRYILNALGKRKETDPVEVSLLFNAPVVFSCLQSKGKKRKNILYSTEAHL